MKRILNFVVAITALLFSANINAQYTGPGSVAKLYTVKDITANASKLDKSDALVEIKGFIVEKINKDTYWFRDSTGQIMIEMDEKDIPSTPFNEKTEVVLTGEIDYDLLEGTEFEVKQFRFANSGQK